MRWYSNYLQSHPWMTKCISSGIVTQIGDLFCQTYQTHKTIDWRRNFNMLIMGTFYFGPMLTTWYTKVLPKITQTLYPNFAKFGKVFTNMIFDRFLFAPIMLTFYYPIYGFVKDLKLSGFVKGWNQTRLKIWDTMVLNWQVWPVAVFCNFWFIDVKYQVLFMNFVAIFWNAILSHLTYK